jgi:streptomycin 6-kinase
MIANGLRQTIERVHGASGRQWLSLLPALLNECCARWSLKLEQPFANLSYNLVIPGRMSDGTEIVLKLGVPCAQLTTEAAALTLYDGAGAVRLLDHDAPRGILLLERVIPGTPLFKLQEGREATRTAATLMRRLWRANPPAEHSFPSLTIWFRALARHQDRFDDGSSSNSFPAELILKARHAFDELNSTSDQTVLLHGDLHHGNILLAEKREWVAIDPKGIVGDPGYEVGAFMLNQLPCGSSESATMKMLDERLSLFSDELQISRERLARWAFCHAVLSALWSFEDDEEWDGTIRLARMLERSA